MTLIVQANTPIYTDKIPYFIKLRLQRENARTPFRMPTFNVPFDATDVGSKILIRKLKAEYSA